MSMYPIATTGVLASNTTNIVLSNIPQTFNHLQLRIFGRSSSAAFGTNVPGGFNGDGGNNYSYHYIGSNAASTFAGATASANALNFGWIAGTTSPSNTFSANVIDILDYTSTNKYKVVKSFNGTDGNSSALSLVGYWSGLWLSTAAITSINLSNTFAAGTRVDLYGISTSTMAGA